MSWPIQTDTVPVLCRVCIQMRIYWSAVSRFPLFSFPELHLCSQVPSPCSSLFLHFHSVPITARFCFCQSPARGQDLPLTGQPHGIHRSWRPGSRCDGMLTSKGLHCQDSEEQLFLEKYSKDRFSPPLCASRGTILGFGAMNFKAKMILLTLGWAVGAPWYFPLTTSWLSLITPLKTKRTKLALQEDGNWMTRTLEMKAIWEIIENVMYCYCVCGIITVGIYPLTCSPI